MLEYAKLYPEKKILFVEYGHKGQKPTNQLDDTIKIDNLTNHHEPYECTNKGLGGSSATWGGRCVMYDEVDFIDRPAVNGGCTWDRSLFNEVKQFLQATCDYFECGESIFDLDDSNEFKGTRITENFKVGVVTDTAIERWSMPTRFGARYEQEILNNANITLLQGYEAREFAEPDITGRVSSVKLRSTTTYEVKEIKAEKIVLAAGTQESTRILLRNKQLFSLLPQPPAALGKYYQGHVSGKIASVKFNGDPKKTEYSFLRDKDGVYLRRRFQFDTQYLVNNNLLNTAMWLDNPLYHDPQHRSGAMSLMYLAMITPILGKKLLPPAIAHSITKGTVKGVNKHIWNVIKQFPGSVLTPATIFYKRFLLKRKLPGIFLYSGQNRYALHFHAEQTPEEYNRMELGADGEQLNIHYTLSDKDVSSVIELHDALDKWLRKNNCGQLEYWYEKNELPNAIRGVSRDGIHQSGTTRIADSPDKGVVDSDLKLFGTSNVYVCSSSVFPTSGQANPTFFLGAFAVRLAHHLTN
ncbi:GMC family oxidoreductase [Mucilaginibacter daejeonensis]|uniref:GMC family oxidoreductase n=1 Tax=Mucilaginibacter daejeonensis TaxID=398049 RepID=UPI001D1720A5|nr:GMC oxidoreductase [Mucilaginibacter daejeonensis]UEG52650.1 GMC family oxidoreductase [Mucilaginibacter daejeonensis]